MNPAVDMAINAILSALFAYLKSQGYAEEEAKRLMQIKVDQIETLKPLPVD